MRLIHTADWHLGRTLFEYSLLEDQRHFLRQLAQFAGDCGADALLIAGDVYNRSTPGAPAVQLLDEFLSEMVLERHIPVVAVAGNHDSAERLSFGSRMLEGAGLYIAGLPQKRLPAVRLGAGSDAVHIHLLPYFTPAQVRALLEDESISTANDAFAALMAYNRPFLHPEETNVLVAHGFFAALSGRGAGDAVFSQSELSVGALDVMDISHAGMFDYVALGHLHAPQKAGREAARYAGSPLKYSVSECRQCKSVTVVDIKGKGDIAVRFHTLAPLRDVRVISGGFEELLDPLNQAGESLEDYVYANITSGDAVLYAMQKLRGLFPHILGLSFMRDSEAQEAPLPTALDEQQALDSLYEAFYQAVTGEALSGERLALVRRLARETEVAAV